jgi:hypothetical protein
MVHRVENEAEVDVSISPLEKRTAVHCSSSIHFGSWGSPS